MAIEVWSSSISTRQIYTRNASAPNLGSDDFLVTHAFPCATSCLDPSTRNEQKSRILITKLLESSYKRLQICQFAGPHDIRMFQETSFSFYSMTYNENRRTKKVLCRGNTDCCFYYFGLKEVQAINLVVIEAKHADWGWPNSCVHVDSVVRTTQEKAIRLNIIGLLNMVFWVSFL